MGRYLAMFTLFLITNTGFAAFDGSYTFNFTWTPVSSYPSPDPIRVSVTRYSGGLPCALSVSAPMVNLNTAPKTAQITVKPGGNCDKGQGSTALVEISADTTIATFYVNIFPDTEQMCQAAQKNTTSSNDNKWTASESPDIQNCVLGQTVLDFSVLGPTS